MEIGEILSQLREEHRLISEAIARLEALESDRGKRTETEAPRKRGRPPGSKNKPRNLEDAAERLSNARLG